VPPPLPSPLLPTLLSAAIRAFTDVEMKQKRVMYGDARKLCERQTQLAPHGPSLASD
jgi:hypothetical protein